MKPTPHIPHTLNVPAIAAVLADCGSFVFELGLAASFVFAYQKPETASATDEHDAPEFPQVAIPFC
ncbi:MAG: hypothetical protein LBT21_02220 [Oscillospiraceae bacterium]|jgi:hypothetical protein|nr:hypothetical protein [Oscillospiraceae bacterium]